MRKIFGIGLPRTGTTSLHLSLILMGIPSIHRPINLSSQLFLNSLSISALTDYDAYTDLPIPIYYREIHGLCPDALFVLTQRDEDAWLSSIEKFFSARRTSNIHTMTRDMLRLAMFGSVTFNEQRFRRVYRNHNTEVESYFGSCPDSFLSLDVSEENAWIKLGSFVGVTPPNTNFPRVSDPNIGKLSAVDRSNVECIRQELLARLDIK